MNSVQPFVIQEHIFAYTRYKQSVNEQVRFVQVGSGDGVTHDPLYQSIVTAHWSGWMLEPVTYMYEQLVANYGYENLDITCINKGIHRRETTKRLYHLRENLDHLPYWYNQLGSFDKEQVLKHKQFIPEIEKYLTSSELVFISVQKLLRQYNIMSLDLLHIDAEGYDIEILNDFLKSDLDLEIILFESKHAHSADLKMLFDRCLSMNYIALQDQEDTLLIKDRVLQSMKVSS